MIMTAFLGRKRVLFGAGAAVLVAAFATWRALGVSELLHIGTGYAAQQTCACVFISGRTLPSCTTELDPLARRLLSVDVGSNEVTARGIGLGAAVARYEPGFGCSLRN